MNKIMSIAKKLLSYIPTALPIGMTEWRKWSQEVVELAGPVAGEDDMKFVIATSIMHMPPNRAFVPKNHFVLLLRKAAANQIASAAFQEIKSIQESKLAAMRAEQQAIQATSEALSSEQTQVQN